MTGLAKKPMAVPYGRFEDDAVLEESARRLQANRDEALDQLGPPERPAPKPMRMPKPAPKPRRARRALRRTISMRGLTYQRLQNYCREQGTPISHMVERWIEEALE